MEKEGLEAVVFLAALLGCIAGAVGAFISNVQVVGVGVVLVGIAVLVA